VTVVLVLVVSLSVGLGAALPSAARADGDPASDVLAGQVLFLPQDAGLPVHQQQEIVALLRQAAQRGVRLRVAVIASRSDLGSVGALWRQPGAYARFLDQELSLVYRGPLLVVMPSGMALAGDLPARLSRDLSTSAPAGSRGSQLGDTVIEAVRRVAADSGHPLGAVTIADSTGGSTDLASLLALAVGALVIALAWAASLRARPLSSRSSS
jgi:hypothetical protein